MMSLLQLDLRTLRTLLALSSTPSSQGKFRKNPPFMLMETETVVETLPEPPLMETQTVVDAGAAAGCIDGYLCPPGDS